MQSRAAKTSSPQPAPSVPIPSIGQATFDKSGGSPSAALAWQPQVAEPPRHEPAGPTSHASHDFSRLLVNAPGDEHEQEAARVAAQVMGATDGPSQTSPAPTAMQTNSGASVAPPIVHEALAGKGQPLDGSARSFMESRLGHDFSQIRIHTNAKAQESAHALDALAYTRGNHIAFGAGQYQPQTERGRHLIAHELRHTIQQRAAAPLIQRAFKFEFQTFNPIWRTKGANNTGPEKLPRKFGPKDLLHRATRSNDKKRQSAGKEGEGMELQSETGGFAEFETPTWSRSLFGLKKSGEFTGVLQTIQEGVAMTEAMNAAPVLASGRKQYPFDVSHLRRSSGSFSNHLRPGEELEVEEVDSAWHGQIQSSESIELTQYESLLREHEFSSFVTSTISGADKLVSDASAAEGIPASRLTRLRSFLQIIVNYIIRGQSIDLKDTPSKAGFRLMSRTSFSSMFRELLTAEEQEAFRNLVRNNNILDALSLNRTDRFFINGHGSERDNKGVTVFRFLQSIYASRLKNNRDYMSPPREDDLSIVGSAAMGRFDVEKTPGKKDSGLIKIETRGTEKVFSNPQITQVDIADVFPGNPDKFNVRVQPAKKWAAYVMELFSFAMGNRQRADVKDDPATKADETQKTGLKI